MVGGGRKRRLPLNIGTRGMSDSSDIDSAPIKCLGRGFHFAELATLFQPPPAFN